MKTEIRQHRWFYLVLIIFLGLTSFLFLAVWPDVVYQRYLVLLMIVFYFLWGLIKELKSSKLSFKIVLEYFGISALAGLLMIMITV